MPNYVPTLAELDLVHDAVGNYNPDDFAALHEYWAFIANVRQWKPVPLPIRKLIGDFERILGGTWPMDEASWPEDIDRAIIPPNLLDHPRSLALALALAIMRQDWDVGAALNEYLLIRNRLLPAWSVCAHTEAQKRRKILDEVVAFGSQFGAGWPVANNVVYYHVFSACVLSGLFLEGPPVGKGLIPDLTASWGRAFREEVDLHATKIRAWLVSPSVSRRFVQGSLLQFTGCADGCAVGGIDKILPGSKRNYILTNGTARLVDHIGILVGNVRPGQHLMSGAFDEGEARIRIAHLAAHGGGLTVAGPELRIGRTRPFGRLLFDANSDLETWSCSCGSFNCDKRHRLSAWDPAAFPPAASLRSFLWTAVKGPGGGRAVLLGNFVGSMYYAYLCGGESQ
jgi:hypothetical protein